MGLAFPVTGTYNVSKANWWAITEPGQTVNNYQRWVYAHSTVLGDLPDASSYFTKSFNFSCSSQSPQNDNANRTTAHNAGVADGGNVAHGSDFLMLGNYVGCQTVTTINGISIPGGKLYWAGQSLASGGSTGAITRGWMEVLSTANLDTLISLVNGNSYTIDGYNCNCDCYSTSIGGNEVILTRVTPGTDHWANLGAYLYGPNVTGISGYWYLFNGECGYETGDPWDGVGTYTFTVGTPNTGDCSYSQGVTCVVCP